MFQFPSRHEAAGEPNEKLGVGTRAGCCATSVIANLVVVPVSLWVYLRFTAASPPETIVGWAMLFIVAEMIAVPVILVAGEVLLGIIGLSAAAQVSSRHTTGRRVRRWYNIVALALLLAGAAVGGYRHWRPSPWEAGPARLLQATESDDTARVEQLLANGADVSVIGRHGETALHIAAWKGNCELIRILLRYHADVMAKGTVPIFPDVGGTPLHFAAGHGNTEAAELLLTSGASVDARDANGWTPLHTVAVNPPGRMMEELLRREKGRASGTTTLRPETEEAISQGLGTMAELLIGHGATVDAKGAAGETPLTIAAGWGTKDVAEVLLTNGADPNAATDDGATPLTASTLQDHPQLIELLLTKGADVDLADQEGLTPLHIVAMTHSPAIAKLLLAKGADVNARAKNGFTPLHCAVFENDCSIAELLLSKGANVDAKTPDGLTPFGALDEADQPDMAKLLRSYGAGQ